MDGLTELLHATMPLCKTLGIRALAMDKEEVRAELDHTPELCTSKARQTSLVPSPKDPWLRWLVHSMPGRQRSSLRPRSVRATD